MWYEVIEKNILLEKLFNKIPELHNVNILRIQLYENGNNVRMSMFLPVLVDNPPFKWKQLKYDTAIIELDLFAVSSVSIKGESKRYKGNISIEKADEETIVLKCEGSVMIDIYAEVAYIQEIRGCRIEEINN